MAGLDQGLEFTERKQFQGFYVLGLKYKDNSSVMHQILMKPHIVREYNVHKPSGRTMLFINIPPYITEELFGEILAKYGKIQRIFFQKLPNADSPKEVNYPLIEGCPKIKGFKVAYVVFETIEEFDTALSQLPGEELVYGKGGTLLSGYDKWMDDYNSTFKSESELRHEVELVMDDYDRGKLQEKRDDIMAKDPDEDGWITVRSKTPKSGGRILNKKRKRRIKKQSMFVDLYSLQHKETKMKHLEEFRKKFAEDKRKIAEMRANRKFKPL